MSFIKQFGLKFLGNGISKRVPKKVISIPSKINNIYKRKDNLGFIKEIEETKTLFRKEGFSERIINNAPLIVEEFNNAESTLVRLAKD